MSKRGATGYVLLRLDPRDLRLAEQLARADGRQVAHIFHELLAEAARRLNGDQRDAEPEEVQCG